MKQLYIIAGPNGAGKTTASFTILPEMLHIDEFVNADEIAKGLSPFNPEKVGFTAGRIMLERIDDLMAQGVSFAFETTLATRSYVGLVKRAIKCGYVVTLIFFALESEELAVQRVRTRVLEGGHNIPEEVIKVRYKKGLRNFFSLFQPIVHKWIFIDNSSDQNRIVARGAAEELEIHDFNTWKHYTFVAYGN